MAPFTLISPGLGNLFQLVTPLQPGTSNVEHDITNNKFHSGHQLEHVRSCWMWLSQASWLQSFGHCPSQLVMQLQYLLFFILYQMDDWFWLKVRSNLNFLITWLNPLPQTSVHFSKSMEPQYWHNVCPGLIWQYLPLVVGHDGFYRFDIYEPLLYVNIIL